MARMPDIQPPDTLEQKKDDRITQVREYRLITPLFGGGVETGEADPVTIIRGSEIRGQLRFWWRATRGGQFGGDPKRMKEAEDLLWGAASTEKKAYPSQVQVSVKLVLEGCKDHPYEVILGQPNQQGQRLPRPRFLNKSVVPSYVAFPLQPNERDPGYGVGMETKSVRVGVRFQLEMTWKGKWTNTAQAIFRDTPQKEIEAALWTWETFGGVGARTRRGFGAIQCTKIMENDNSIPLKTWLLNGNSIDEVVKWIKNRLEDYTSTDDLWPEAVPHLSQNSLASHLKITDQNVEPQDYITRAWTTLVKKCETGSNVDQALEVLKKWHYLIEQLKDFRQKRDPGTPAGRSRWPEPSTIREITGQSLSAHSTPIPDPIVKKFPRAAFGLPIIFQFKGSHDYRADREPRMTELRLEVHERLASPLILRPLLCQGGSVFGLALILDGAGLFTRDEAGNPIEYEPLKLEARKGNALGPSARNLSANLDASEAARLKTHSGALLLGGGTDILKAFLNTL